MNFKGFKGRTITPNQKVRVYRNLHKPGVVYSIQDPSTGLVLGYSEAVLLSDVTFKVSEAGRRRVLATKRKNVHAFVEGTLTDTIKLYEFMLLEKLAYNPYRYTSFVRKADETMVHTATLAMVDDRGVHALYPN